MDNANNSPSRLVERIRSINTYLSEDLFGGPRPVRMAWVINIHKVLTLPVVLLMMLTYQSFSTVAWVYLALHGSYGICWLLKHFAFREPKWEVQITWAAAVFTFILLGTYWIAPFILISEIFNPDHSMPASWFVTFCISVHTLGIVIMISADCQKHYALKRERSLITDGMFRLVRHPNYLGEMMVYASYALLVQHWIPWVVLVYWWTMVFLVNMLKIEASLSRYAGWVDYKASSAMLVPWLL